MQPHISTTPFGGRPLTRAMMDTQTETAKAPVDAVAHKWRVWRNLAIAKDRLGVSDRALAVLNALLSFHQATALQGTDDLVVFPSNRELSLRAHGMAPATLRRHLAVLVGCGLVIRRDSPNGKRYARKGEGGEVDQAFGFDLAPLVARAREFEALAEAVTADLKACALLRERITILRRDVGKSIELGLDEGIDAVDWLALSARLATLSQGLLRRLARNELEGRAERLSALFAEVAKALAKNEETKETDAKESQTERHIQNSKTDPYSESELPSEEAKPQRPRLDGEEERAVRTYPLGMVLEACPAIFDWHQGPINDWCGFEAAVKLARAALGISSSAYEEARAAMGKTNTSICIAAILQRSDFIRSPGGYLRSLCRKAEEGGFSVGPVLMALLRSNVKGQRSA